MNAKTIGTIIKKHRLKQGITQVELARRCGYRRSQIISNIERGDCLISVKKISVFCDTLGIDSEKLFKKVVKAKVETMRETFTRG